MTFRMAVLMYSKEGNFINLKPSNTDLERVNEHFVSSKYIFFLKLVLLFTVLISNRFLNF